MQTLNSIDYLLFVDNESKTRTIKAALADVGVLVSEVVVFITNLGH